MFFYSGTFADPEFKKIEGVIQRNRDLVSSSSSSSSSSSRERWEDEEVE